MSQRRAAERDIQIVEGEPSSRRLRAESDYLYGLREYFPHKFSNPFTPDQEEMVQAFIERARFGGNQGIAGPRGEGKTTIIVHMTILAILHGLLEFPLIVAATGDHATEILDAIKDELVTNDLLWEDFPLCCKVARYVESAPQKAMSATVNGKRVPIAWKADRIRLPNGAIVRTRGITAAFRGMNVRGKRPDLVILDDVDTRESASSVDQTDKRRVTIEQDIAGLGGPGKKISVVMLCTVINRQCLAFEYTDPKLKPAWRGKRFRLLIEKPDHPEIWDHYIQLRLDGMATGDDLEGTGATAFYLENREKMDQGAQCSNPNRYIDDNGADGKPLEHSALQHCYNLIANGMKDGKDGWLHFATEYQNAPPEEEGPQTSALSAELLRTRLSGLPQTVVPKNATVLTAGLDIGKRIIHYTVTAWMQGAQGTVIDYGTLDGFPRDMMDAKAVDVAVKQALHRWREEVLADPYLKSDGEVMPVNLALIDASYATDGVYAFCKEVGSKGAAPFMGAGDTGDSRAKLRSAQGKEWQWYQQKDMNLWLCMGNSDYWKSWIHERFLTPPGRHGSLTMFGSDRKTHISYSQHLVAEVEETTFVQGKGLKTRWNKRNKDNHWFDATYMAAVAAAEKGIRLIAQPVKARNQTKKASSNGNSRFLQRPGGWVRGQK